MREFIEINRKVNGRMENLYMFIMKRYFLVYECIFYDVQENQNDVENYKVQMDFFYGKCLVVQIIMKIFSFYVVIVNVFYEIDYVV